MRVDVLRSRRLRTRRVVSVVPGAGLVSRSGSASMSHDGITVVVMVAQSEDSAFMDFAVSSRDDGLRVALERRRDAAGVAGLGVAVVEAGRVAETVPVGLADAATSRPVNVDTLFHACSMAKLVTAVGVLRLAQDGQLDMSSDVDVSLRDWALPRADSAAGRTVTVTQLLAHEAGIDDPDGSFAPLTGDPRPVADVLRGQTSAHPGEVTARRAPGERFSYSDAGYCVVEQVVEDVTGRPFAEAMRALVFAPLGMARTAFWDGTTGALEAQDVAETDAAVGHDAAGRSVPGGRAHYPGLAASGLWTTPHDLAILIVDLMAAWRGETGAVLLNPDSGHDMLTAGGEPTVGLGLFLPDVGGQLCVQSHGWGLGFQSLLRAYPRRNAAVAAMINADPGAPQADSLTGEAVRAVSAQWI